MLSIFGCKNNTGNNLKFDVNTVADALNSNLSFGESLEKSTPEVLFSIYGVDASLCTNAAFYSNSGAVADEVAVFECTDSSASNEITEAINNRIEYLRDGYSSYGPDQVPKIDKATVISDGNIIVFCICNNSEEVSKLFYSTATAQ